MARKLLTVLMLFGFQSAIHGQHESQTAIDRYVNAADASYRWEVVHESELDGIESVIVDMTSQTWLTKEQVSQPVWKHWVNIAIPTEIRTDAALLMISGGSNDGDPPKSVSEELRQVARATGSIVAELKMVPNQPLIFHGDGKPRKEDDLIGYTWDQYLETGDPTWLARNAMVKSAVRAMDTVQAVVEKQRNTRVDRFVVAGASKRGWTTWLTGAIDDRVVAIIPIVIDVLNVDKSMRHHFAAYGYWAPAIGNYVDHRIMQRLDHPRLKELYRLVDPYAYRDRLDMPKLMLNAAGDQFFLPDSSQFYLGELKGENHVRYVPNTDHSMRDSDALESVLAFYFSIAHNVPRPEYTWKVLGDKLRVECKTQPKEVKLWRATNPSERDFRLETLGPKYEATSLNEVTDGIYVAQLQTPDQGWAAQFIELTFDVGAPVPLKLTTAISVLPVDLPYAERNPASEASITLRCKAENKERAIALSEQVAALMSTKLAIEGVKHIADESEFYLNWKPSDFRREAGAIMEWLESNGCTKINVQLESGRHITTKPQVLVK